MFRLCYSLGLLNLHLEILYILCWSREIDAGSGLVVKSVVALFTDSAAVAAAPHSVQVVLVLVETPTSFLVLSHCPDPFAPLGLLLSPSSFCFGRSARSGSLGFGCCFSCCALFPGVVIPVVFLPLLLDVRMLEVVEPPLLNVDESLISFTYLREKSQSTC